MLRKNSKDSKPTKNISLTFVKIFSIPNQSVALMTTRLIQNIEIAKNN